MNKKIIDAIKGGLWGLIVGDALGVTRWSARCRSVKKPAAPLRY